MSLRSSDVSSDGPRRRRRRRLAGLAILGLAGLVFVGLAVAMTQRDDRDAARQARPAQGRSRVVGFGEVGFSLLRAGERRAGPGYCALLAEHPDQLRRGLMGRRDLAGYQGMIFRFPEDTRVSFYMRNVPQPLSIAWFDSTGRFVSSTDMAPCADRDDCPRYAAAGPYRYALEVREGGLARLGAQEGSVLVLEGSCEGR